MPKPGKSSGGGGASATGGDGAGTIPPSSGPGEGPGAGPSESISQGHGPSWHAPSTGQAKRAIDVLERSLRQGKADPDLLDELGWDVATAQRFVEAFKRSNVKIKRESNEPPNRSTQSPVQTGTRTPRSDQVLRAAGPIAPGARGLHEADTRPADDMHDLMEAGRQRVPAQYEAVLKAYYQTLASQPSP